MQRDDRFNFSRRKITANIKETNVFSYGFKTDRYGNQEYSYPTEPSGSIDVMWSPISSEVEIAEYGERINEMMQACVFSDEELKEKDRVEINFKMYNIVAIKQYPSYRLVLAERVR